MCAVPRCPWPRARAERWFGGAPDGSGAFIWMQRLGEGEGNHEHDAPFPSAGAPLPLGAADLILVVGKKKQVGLSPTIQMSP
jgi:hypothetical protein